jgi:tetratricopeptide (TPR) repeat protein
MFQAVEMASVHQRNLGTESDQSPNLSPFGRHLEGFCSNRMTRQCHNTWAPLQFNTTKCIRPDSSDQQARPLQHDEGTFDENTSVFLETAQKGRRLQDSGDFQSALLCYNAALHCKDTTIDWEPAAIQAAYADVLFEVGMIHMAPTLNNETKCIEVLHDCLDLRRACLGSLDIDVAKVLLRLADVYSTSGDQQYASELLVESLSILLCINPSNKYALVEVWTALGLVQEALGDTEDAESSFKEAQKLAYQS